MPISGKPEIGAVAHAAFLRRAWAKSRDAILPTLQAISHLTEYVLTTVVLITYVRPLAK
jgi:hypothetical protein